MKKKLIKIKFNNFGYFHLNLNTKSWNGQFFDKTENYLFLKNDKLTNWHGLSIMIKKEN